MSSFTLSRVARVAAAATWTGSLAGLALITTSLGIWAGEHTMPRLWSRGVLRLLGIRLQIVGAERIDLAQPHVFLSNHRSAIDPLLLVAALRHMPRFVAKSEINRIPLFGVAFRRLGHISIDRRQPEAARQALAAAAKRLGTAHSVYFAPEGRRRGTHPPSLAEFRRGAFDYAVATGLLVVPVVIRDSERVWPPGGLRVTPGVVTLEFLPPLARSTSAAKLRDRAYQALLAAGAWPHPGTWAGYTPAHE